MPGSEDGWNEYKKLVVSELERLDNDIKELNKKLDVIIIDLTALKTKMGIIGFMAGLIAGAIVSFVMKK